ncbi:MAG: PAS domain-containing protein [Bdellovibrionales bacterium]|nr:PAS domain-containing protein [Bdellovibrionales bacterium]
MKKQVVQVSPLLTEKQKLYQALLYTYQIHSLQDLLLLQKKEFLDLCGISHLDFHFIKDNFKKEFFSLKQKIYPFQYIQNLEFKGFCYGKIEFYSHKKILKSKKTFLNSIVLSLSSSLYFIDRNQNFQTIKKQWRNIFNSFSQAFCITNEKFEIIRCNQAFEKLFCKKKEDLFFKNLFQQFPFPLKIPPFFFKKPSSFIARSKKENQPVYWEISCEKIYLQTEHIQIFLFLVKDISQEIKWEAKISAQSQEQEIGWMKGSLAHELNNPIAGIKILLSVIEREVSDENILQNLSEMQKSIDSCHKVVQDLLLASK